MGKSPAREMEMVDAKLPGKASKENRERPYPKPTQVDWLRRLR